MSQRYGAAGMAFMFLLCVAWPARGAEVVVKGRVLGPEGQAQADCHVIVWYYSGPAADWWHATAQTVSDATGHFSFQLDVGDPTRPVHVAAVKTGFAADWAVVRAEDEVTPRLRTDPVTCAGLVTDDEGRPIARARVSVRFRDQSRSWESHLQIGGEHALSDVTDEQGRFEIGNLPRSETLALMAVANGRERRALRAPLSTGRRDIRLALRPEATISGRVTHGGQPVAAARVFARGGRPRYAYGEALTGDDGSYRIEHLPGAAYDVRIYPPQGLTAKALQGIELSAGDHFTGADLQLSPGGLVQGTVTEAGTQRLLPGACIGASGPHGYQRAITDEAGTYALRLPEGESRVSYSVAGVRDFHYTSTEPRERTVNVIEGQTVTGVDFVLQPSPRRRGKVVGPDGQPAAGVQVGRLDEVPSDSWEQLFRSRSDADGNFAALVSKAFPGRAVLARDVAGGLAGITRAEGLGKPVQVRLAEGAWFLAAIIDAAGQPVRDTAVGLLLKYDTFGANFFTARTDQQGRVRVGPLPPNVPLQLSPGRDTSARVLENPWRDLEKIPLMPGEEYELPPLQVAFANLRGRTVRGHVLDEDGQPIPGAIVFGSRTQEPALADDEGRFELRELPVKGNVLIMAAHPTEPLFAAKEMDPDLGESPRLVLQAPGRAAGRILDEDGQPMSGARIWARPRFRYSFPSEFRQRLEEAGFSQGMRTGQDGQWQLEGLLAGFEWYIMGHRPKSTMGSSFERITPKPGEMTDLGETTLRPVKLR